MEPDCTLAGSIADDEIKKSLNEALVEQENIQVDKETNVNKDEVKSTDIENQQFSNIDINNKQEEMDKVRTEIESRGKMDDCVETLFENGG